MSVRLAWSRGPNDLVLVVYGDLDAVENTGTGNYVPARCIKSQDDFVVVVYSDSDAVENTGTEVPARCIKPGRLCR